ncbi:MAG: DUF5615 family PIN-like protein [Leptospiraceae bacterium]|nr:DUF5615 family PIN-like protein [Leptospiraceae bacterium]MBK9502196.1 DUF5615 family PIN-like protein [Leptospiraceae bacterium]
MNFIVDAMLPSALSKWLRIKGFDSIHTSELEEGNATDDTILFRLSMETERVVITKDHDFIERFLIKNEPKKLLLITTGNLSNKKLIALFETNLDAIINHLETNSVIELSLLEIIVHF